ncbi:ATP-binding protein [Ramlibacter tataouinensis]|uniref:ATP-binding protein n=1 Tax=Ramlibacter tataouinensis TaxID=94132 RepID=UPI0022F3C606|nr:ATP-binding protein [Ramlibacter tataouinensis]WBY02433.1 ATP-binding protein [Ramlibacter tataouinensis]
MSSRASEAATPAHSLRRRLLGLVLAAVALASALQAASAYRTALRTADALFDTQLQALARSAQAGLPLRPGEELDYTVQIWAGDGVLLFRAGPALPPPAVIGFSEQRVDGTRYRLYTLRTGDRSVQIAQDLDRRQARARALALEAVVPVGLLGLLLMLAVWFVIDRSLAPVQRLRRQVAARPAEDLSPLEAGGLPQEVQPLVHDLNALFARVREALAAQQRFVADAAHELRSPLTALKLQAQSLQREPAGPARDAALARLEQGIARAIGLVTQLLALAREEGEPAGVPAPVDLEALCRQAVADVLPLARDRQVDVGLADAPAGPLSVQGDADSLRTLLRNLLDNAVKYTPAGGQVDIVLGPAPGGGTLLAVEDSGPGVPPADRERVFDRFWRGPDEDAPGSGLGLPIVAAIARRHGAQVQLGESKRLGGLRVEVRFP